MRTFRFCSLGIFILQIDCFFQKDLSYYLYVWLFFETGAILFQEGKPDDREQPHREVWRKGAGLPNRTAGLPVKQLGFFFASKIIKIRDKQGIYNV